MGGSKTCSNIPCEAEAPQSKSGFRTSYMVLFDLMCLYIKVFLPDRIQPMVWGSGWQTMLRSALASLSFSRQISRRVVR